MAAQSLQSKNRGVTLIAGVAYIYKQIYISPLRSLVQHQSQSFNALDKSRLSSVIHFLRLWQEGKEEDRSYIRRLP